MSTTENFAMWPDFVSLILLGTIYTMGSFPTVSDVRRPLKENFLRIISAVLLVMLSAVRFIIEGMFFIRSSWQFPVIGIFYLSGWLWLFLSLRKSGTAIRGFKVADALLGLHTVRLGISPFRDRYRKLEMVLRKGKPSQGNSVKKDVKYWQGFIQSTECYEDSGVWVVELVEERLHARRLEKLGVVAYNQGKKLIGLDEIYRMVYELIMAVDGRHPHFAVDFEPFFSCYSAVRIDTSFARRTGCTDTSPLANVARRVAADACYYIRHEDAEATTSHQVRLINMCIDNSIKKFVKSKENVPGPTGPRFRETNAQAASKQNVLV